MTTYLIKAKGAKPKPGHSAAGASTRSSKAAAELLREGEAMLTRKTLPSKRVKYTQ